MSDEANIHNVGTATIIRVKDLDLTSFTPKAILPEWESGLLVDHPGCAGPETMGATPEHLLMSVHAWVVRDGDRTILIDPGAGNDKERPYAPHFDHLHTPFLENLRTAGVEPEDVDYVLMTHLHVDHVGWNTRQEGGRWVPTFPNAKYIFAQAEYDYFTDPRNHDDRNRTSFMVQRDSVDPVIRAGLAQMIQVDGREVIPGFTFLPTPGHTAAHASIVFTSGEAVALFTGDLLHHHLQVFRPDLASVFDAFPETAAASRVWALHFAADNKAIIFSSHLSGPSAGRVTRDAVGLHWAFL